MHSEEYENFFIENPTPKASLPPALPCSPPPSISREGLQVLDTLPAPSPPLLWTFAVLPGLVSAAFIWAIGRTSGPGAARRALLALLLWSIATAALGVSGFLDAWSPPRMLLLFLGILAFLGWAARQPWTQRLGDLSLRLLVGFQAFRIAVEFALHEAVEQGIAPPTLTWTGTNWDIVPGVTALLLIPFVERLDRRALQAWNLTMAGVLVVTVSTSLLAAPTPFRLIQGYPPNVFVAGFPFVWLPMILVPSAWLGHIVLYRRLRRPSERENDQL